MIEVLFRYQRRWYTDDDYAPFSICLVTAKSLEDAWSAILHWYAEAYSEHTVVGDHPSRGDPDRNRHDTFVLFEAIVLPSGGWTPMDVSSLEQAYIHLTAEREARESKQSEANERAQYERLKKKFEPEES